MNIQWHWRELQRAAKSHWFWTWDNEMGDSSEQSRVGKDWLLSLKWPWGYLGLQSPRWGRESRRRCWAPRLWRAGALEHARCMGRKKIWKCFLSAGMAGSLEADFTSLDQSALSISMDLFSFFSFKCRVLMCWVIFLVHYFWILKVRWEIVLYFVVSPLPCC